jgi:Acetyl-CoA dehydrogenase C-terminal like
MIYEGTNEIQAIDLLVRKVLGNEEGARGFESLLSVFESEARACASFDSLNDFAMALRAQCHAARQTTVQLRGAGGADAELRWRVADDYLGAFGHLLMTWAWAKAARTSLHLPNRDFATRKTAVCRFGIDWMHDEGTLLWERVQRAPPLASLT